MYESGALQRAQAASTRQVRVSGSPVSSQFPRASSNDIPSSPRPTGFLHPLSTAAAQNTVEGATARILLVEDNPDNRDIYRVILEHTGYAVIEAKDGEEALRAAREERPDMILMDLSIPKMSGLEVTRILKSESTTRRVPIVALTAFAMVSDRLRAEEAGCDGYLAKPVEPRAVVEEVKRQLSRIGRAD